VAGHQGLGGGHEAVGELGVDAALDVQPRAGQADLARVAEDGADRPGDGVVRVGVVEDDVGALSIGSTSPVDSRAWSAKKR
jgi:hypothetical protein